MENRADYVTRQARRHAVDQSVQLSGKDLLRVEVVVRDVSSSGFMAECPQPVLIGSEVILDVPGLGPVEAQVRWQLGSRMGGRFVHPISLEQCEWSSIEVLKTGDPA